MQKLTNIFAMMNIVIITIVSNTESGKRMMGDLVKEKQFPFLVALVGSKLKVRCSGALVTTSNVVTTAVCIKMKPTPKYVFAGTVNVKETTPNPNMQKQNITRTELHPDWTKCIDFYFFNCTEFDLAVAWVHEPFELADDYVSLIKFANSPPTMINYAISFGPFESQNIDGNARYCKIEMEDAAADIFIAHTPHFFSAMGKKDMGGLITGTSNETSVLYGLISDVNDNETMITSILLKRNAEWLRQLVSNSDTRRSAKKNLGIKPNYSYSVKIHLVYSSLLFRCM